MANPWERDWSQPAPSREGVYRPPSQNKQRKEGADAERAQNEATISGVEAQYAPQVTAAQVDKMLADAQKSGRESAKQDLELQRGALSDTERGNAISAFDSARELYRVADEIEKQYREGSLSKTSGLAGIKDFIPSGENRKFEATGSQARGYLKSALGFTGGEGNTMAESEATYGPYLPTSWDSNATVENKLSALRALADSARRKSVMMLGGIPDASGKIEPLPLDEGGRPYLPQANLARQAPQSESSLSAQGRGNVIMDPALSGFGAQIRDAFINGATSDQLIAMEAAKMAELGRPLGADRIQFYRDLDKVREQNPNAPLGGIPIDWGRIETTTEQAGPTNVLGMIGESPLGAGVASAANAAAFGLPAALSGDQGDAIMNAMREESPYSSFAGDLIGSGAALAGLGAMAPVRGLSALGKGGGLGADLAYSTVRGGIEGGPIGAGIGFASGLAGDVAGRGIGQVARRSGATGGPERPDTYLRLIGKEVDEVDPVVQALTAGRAIGAPVNVADVAPQLRPMAGAAFRRSDWDTQNTANQALVDRQLNQYQRYNDAIERELGPLGNPEAAQQELIRQGREASAPFYQAFEAEAPAMTPTIEEILATGQGRSAMGRAASIAEMEGRPLGEIDAETLIGTPSPRTLDLVKRGFDDILYNSTSPISGIGRTERGALEGMRQRYVGELDNLYPDSYPQARAAYGGPASIADAMAQGQEALKLNPRAIPDVLSGLNPQQLEAYQFGARQSLADKAAGVVDTADPWRSGLGAPASRERVRAIFGEEPAQNLTDALDVERAMLATNQATIGNSATAGRLAADEKLSGDMAGEMGASAAIDMATGGAPVATGLGLANRFLKDRAGLGFAGAREGVASDMARFLLNTDMEVDEIARLLAQGVDYEKYAQEVRRRAAMGGTALTNSAIATSGTYGLQ